MNVPSKTKKISSGGPLPPSSLPTHYQKLSRTYRKLSAAPASKLSTDDIHYLRTLLRRLEAMLLLMEPGKKVERALKDIRKLQRSLSKVRKLDVVLEDARAFHLKAPGLKRRRRRAFQDVRPRLSRGHRKRLGQKIEALKQRTFDLGPEILLLRLEIEEWLKPQRLAKTHFHELRLFVKRLRYTMEALEGSTDELAHLQTDLGRIHDLQTLGKYLKRTSSVVREEKKLKREITSSYRKTLRPYLRLLPEFN